ncbi:sterol regulatory element-binding protein cleavage-activating protein [Niveomyces insectorum RCEF 264]|uniref:Sterol regulatory element-binding protein cleavage-activating protein n=1 Tax=Niveomyces insectorum RCEF 264 TaxID=1081102 RepID=A0A167TCX4_9HYPO|nr:sterol regulatory element-binding protein cleavage-activating protein [Niveomyces insectorum RCEF 264]
MLWTTSAPDLAPDNPIRSALTRYGVGVARHVATTLLISLAVATALVYPIPFLYSGDFTSGASSVPRHVWTNAQPLQNGTAVEPDAIMRSIWVHGTYMKALDRDVLLGALELQDELLGPTTNFDPRRSTKDAAALASSFFSSSFSSSSSSPSSVDLTPAERDAFHVVNGLTNQSWFFHSPLLYWSGNREAILSDPDILATVNAHKNQHTSVNVTLRHSVVFSGKRFEGGALVAADALVITLIHLRDSPVGRQWERKAAGLAARVADTWDVYPKDTHELPSQLYEFQFLPLSLQDSIMLAVAYTLTLVYVVQNLSRLPAIKSRPGLVLTVVAQIFASIMSSFTFCAVLQIDLSRIPRAAYPIVIVSMSLENMLRLIKGVIATKLEDSTSSRIGAAFGKTTHVAVVSVVEHLLLLWAMAQFVTAGLSDFCAFLAIAIVFDFFYFSTFFLSVLSIEVRRTELSEIIEKTSSMRRTLQVSDAASPSQVPYGFVSPAQHTMHTTMPPRQSWKDALWHGRVDVPTRVAGTVILFGFVVIAQWHFFGNESMARTLGRPLVAFRARFGGGSGGGGGGGGGGSSSSGYNLTTTWYSASPQFEEEIHQARSPTSWLCLQDHETAREVIQVVKPWAHSYVARVYEPLVLVRKGADRMPAATERPFLPAVYDFVRLQSKPFVVTILVVAAVVRIFLSYLLWDEYNGEGGAAGRGPNEPVLTVKTLDQGHALDVALLAASSDGLVVSVGLDRWIRVWNVPFGGMSYVLTNYNSTSLSSLSSASPSSSSSSSSSPDVPFPVLALAIDDDSVWLAILSSYRVMLWDLEAKTWGPSVPVDLYGQKPEAFFFTPKQRSPRLRSLVIVRRNGSLVELWADTGESMDHPVCKSPLVCAVPLHCLSSAAGPHTGTLAIVTASRNGCVHRVLPVGDGWISEEIKQQAGRVEHAHSLVALPLFSSFLVVRPRSVDLVDLGLSTTIHTFAAATPIQARSLRYLCSTRRTSQRRGAAGLSYFSLVYTSAETGHCVMQTFLPRDEEDGCIAFFPDDPSEGGGVSCTWNETRQLVQQVPNPGTWEVLPNGCIIGVRQTGGYYGPGGGDGRGRATGVEVSLGKEGSAFRRRRSQRAQAGSAQAATTTTTTTATGSTTAPETPAAAATATAATTATTTTGEPASLKTRWFTSSSEEPADGRGIWEAWSVCNVVDYSKHSADSESSGGSAGGPGDNLSSRHRTTGGQNRYYVTQPLGTDQGELLVAEPGPMACVGAGTVALGLGATVKIITMGHERFGSPADMLEAAAGQMAGPVHVAASRRRKARPTQKG